MGMCPGEKRCPYIEAALAEANRVIMERGRINSERYDEIADLKAKLAAALIANNDYKRAWDEQAKKLAAAFGRLTVAVDRIAALEAEVAEASDMLAQDRRIMSSLTSENKALDEQITELRASFEADKERLQKSFDIMKASADAAMAENARLKADNERRQGPCVHHVNDTCWLKLNGPCDVCVNWESSKPAPPASAEPSLAIVHPMDSIKPKRKRRRQA